MVSRCKKPQGLACQQFRREGLIYNGNSGSRRALRRAVVAKNEQFFNKWRPQNETYLFGFRKHEQGRNATEIAEFDPFIAKAEDEIAKIRKSLSK